MSTHPSHTDLDQAALSALMDGEASEQEIAQLCDRWRQDDALRADWSNYQLIGDVMRSDDLARPGDSEAFLNRFRNRLAQEPVVLAPAAMAQAPSPVAGSTVLPLRRRRWAGPMAVAASFVMIVASAVSLQMGGSPMAPVDGAGLMAGVSAGDSPWQPVGAALQAAHRQDSVMAGASFSRPTPPAADVVHEPVEALLAAPEAVLATREEGASAAQLGLIRPTTFAAP